MEASRFMNEYGATYPLCNDHFRESDRPYEITREEFEILFILGR
jgi:hypothetical protein